MNLEPYRTELEKEIDKTKIEVERLTISRNLDEITEEEYIRKGGPLQARLDTLRGKLREFNEIFEFPKGPARFFGELGCFLIMMWHFSKLSS